MSFLNLVPIALLLWFFFITWKNFGKNEFLDVYFRDTKSPAKRRYRNLFGVPYPEEGGRP